MRGAPIHSPFFFSRIRIFLTLFSEFKFKRDISDVRFQIGQPHNFEIGSLRCPISPNRTSETSDRMPSVSRTSDFAESVKAGEMPKTASLVRMTTPAVSENNAKIE